MDTFNQSFEINERPWGMWHLLLDNFELVVKLLVVYPGGMLSLQSHEHRNEQWNIIQGEAIVYCAGTDTVMMQPGTSLLSKGDTYYIPKNVKHRLINPTAEAVVILETITGKYDEEDIVRYHDSYGRV